MSDLSHLASHSIFNVKGWTAVVTGGGTGLGLITAKALAANGAKVYVTGRRADKLKSAELTDSKSGGSILGLQMDVTDKDSIAAGVKVISSKEKHINLLVNNAGISTVNYGKEGFPKGDIHKISETMFNNQGFDDWLDSYKVDVAACYFTAVALLPLLVAARDNGYPEAGSIINISSISGMTKESQNGQFAYNAAKAATVSLSNQLAVDLKRPGIEVRVNQIAPGYFPSEMTPIEVDKGKNKEHFRSGFWQIPFGRGGNEVDYAQAILSCACNRYMTGALLCVDGGWMLAHA